MFCRSGIRRTSVFVVSDFARIDQNRCLESISDHYMTSLGGTRALRRSYAAPEPNAFFDKIGAPTGEITHVANLCSGPPPKTVYFVTVDQYTTLLSNEKPEV